MACQYSCWTCGVDLPENHMLEQFLTDDTPTEDMYMPVCQSCYAKNHGISEAEDGRLQGMADWVWEHQKLEHSPKSQIWWRAYTDSWDEMERKARDERQI